ncbi:MAG TPA: hypothetical protein VMS43_05610 [Allosphingosinicella sp.]|nr:hypothetical protein [Allosphingosinicella sp.]
MKFLGKRRVERKVLDQVIADPEIADPDIVVPDDIEGLAGLPPLPASGAIADDRQLLVRLGLSDVDTAMILTKTRQALNNQLGPKKAPAGQQRPTNYFRMGEIALLVGGARQLDRPIDVPAIKHYVAATRSAEIGKPAYQLLMKSLEGESEEIDLADASTVVFLLPAFADLRAARGDVAMNLLYLAHALPRGEEAPAVFVLSSTEMQARMAGQWLGLDTGSNCFGRDIVDHYLPTVLVYCRDRDESRPYVLTERGTFEAAPKFRSNMIADCVRSLMPSEMRPYLSPAAPDA